MNRLALILLFLVAGCSSKPDCIPCKNCKNPSTWHHCSDQADVHEGYMFYAEWNGGQKSHCIPCTSATSPEARFVCFGEKAEPTAPQKLTIQAGIVMTEEDAKLYRKRKGAKP